VKNSFFVIQILTYLFHQLFFEFVARSFHLLHYPVALGFFMYVAMYDIISVIQRHLSGKLEQMLRIKCKLMLPHLRRVVGQ